MPVTPYHFGPGILLKALGPRWISLTAFMAANVVIDIEVVVQLALMRAPLHATLHTFLFALPVGALVGFAVTKLGRWVQMPPAEVALRPALLGGALGGLSQPLLDGIMHADIRPFLPLTADNPLFRIVGLDPLHLACLVTGAVGLAVLAVRAFRENAA